MAVIKRAPKPASDAPEEAQKAALIAAPAPDSKAESVQRGKLVKFPTALEQGFLDEVDAFRQHAGLSRNAVIRIALRRLLDSGAV
ncbi:ribbon-helix-helix domain-containing protein [Pseudomonas fluorescens group sp. PF-69]